MRPVQFSKHQEQWFRSCSPADGGGFFNSEGAIAIPDMRFDWIKREDSEFRVQISDLLGRVINDLSWTPKQKKIRFLKSSKWSKYLSIDSEGYIIADGNNMGLKMTDLPCFLQGKLPNHWKNKFFKGSACGQYVIQDGAVKITTAFRAGRQKTLCSMIQWSKFFGMITKEAKICLSDDESFIQFEHYRLNWKLDHD